MTTTKYTKNDELNAFIDQVKEAGYTIILNDNSKNNITWFKFFKDGYMGYVQVEYFGGFNFSTEAKPTKNLGTGSRVLDMVDLTMENIEKTLAFARNYYAQHGKDILYSSPEEYLKSPVNQILKPYILK